jgi:hypothetical protein
MLIAHLPRAFRAPLMRARAPLHFADVLHFAEVVKK